LDDLADKTYLDGGDRDIARLRLLDLDPLQRHGYYDFDEVGQLAALWNGLEHANARATRIAPPPEALYSLRASAALVEEANGSVSADMREMQRRIFFGPALKGPAVAFYEHALVVNARSLMGLETLGLLD
jgi:hypothetical protein